MNRGELLQDHKGNIVRVLMTGGGANGPDDDPQLEIDTTITRSRTLTHYNLRTPRPPNCGNRWLEAPSRTPTTYHHGLPDLEETVLTQVSMKKGLQIIGDKGAKSVLKEMKQLHDMQTLEPKTSSQERNSGGG